MLRVLLLVVLYWAGPASAAQVDVIAGQHDTFTRLVLTLPQPLDWRLGRSERGYDLQLIGMAPEYDLSNVFSNIPRNRLTDIAYDTATHNLNLILGCACHAIPFELRPGVVVIDLRDGPPPEGSSFEQTLAGQNSTPLVPDQSFAWLEWTDAARLPNLADGFTAPKPQPERIALQEAMLHQFARAATQGLIDPAGHLPDTAAAKDAPEMANVRIGPNITLRSANESPAPIAGDGETCPADSDLDISQWAKDVPAAYQLENATSGLLGEFDQLSQDGLQNAVRIYLYYGFGVEARQMLNAFGNPREFNLLRSMSHLVDAAPDKNGAFAGMGQCDTAAALWAALADPDLPPDQLNLTALVRAFAALPPHLRRHLGPALAERFQAAGEETTTAALHAAMSRVAVSDDTRAALMDARLNSPQEPELAEKQFQDLIVQAGPDLPQTLISLIDLRFAERKAVDLPTVTALESVLAEAEGGPDAPAAARALMLGQALAGNFDAAFVTLNQSPKSVADLWQLTAESAPDSTIIQHAITAPVRTIVELPRELRRSIATRLMGLGFADAALTWDGGIDPQLTAQARLAQGKPDLALVALRRQSNGNAAELRALAELALNEPQQAAIALGAAPDDQNRDRALAWRADWQGVAAHGQGSWQSAAANLNPSADGTGPLSRGRHLIDHSAQTRAALETLLAETSTAAGNDLLTNSP